MKKMFRKSCISLCMLCLMLFCTRNVYAAKTDSLAVGGYAGEVNDSEKNGANSSLLRSSVQLDNTKLVMYPTQTKKLIPYSAGNKVSGKWKSSNKSVVSVSSKGKLTAKKAGTATITVTVEGTSATCKVTVKNPSVSLNKAKATVNKGDTLQLKAVVKGPSSKTIWKSLNTSIATVDSKGVVSAKKLGTAAITATANGISAKCKVVVTQKIYTYEYAYNINDFGKWVGTYKSTIKICPISSSKIKFTSTFDGKTEQYIATKVKNNTYKYIPKKGLYPGWVQKFIWDKENKRVIMIGFEEGKSYYLQK